MDAAAVVDRLGLDESVRGWLEEAAALPLPEGGVPLPGRAGAAAALAPFAPAERDAAELLEAWPDPTWPLEAWWLLERMYARVAADIAADRREWRAWPNLVAAEDVRARCAVVYALAAAVPLLDAVYDRHGIPPQVRSATLGDIGRHIGHTRAMFGRLGLETATWAALHFRAGLFELGRLQYEPATLFTAGAVTWYGPGEAAGLGPELAEGAPALRLHIPADGPLDPPSVQRSLDAARGFFRSCFAADYPVATCTSWLLDPQLADHLPPSSNILAFQRRFTLVEADAPGDADVFRFVFRMPEVDPERAPTRTTLERAAAGHVRSGGSWRVRTGWLRLA
ncbi:acyltransferase domain-containing protein [Nocardiopsis sediminis]|uniref:Acyltransferase domain-containing protein n=1 Tax=Nocardiopsis sediminis TaxID=1778267 RepID=A0ABV8FN90_9ACTN